MLDNLLTEEEETLGKLDVVLEKDTEGNINGICY